MPAPDRIPSEEVRRADFVAIVSGARSAIATLEDRFIQRYLSPTEIYPASQYDYDVAAYCVLAHGVLEYLIEDIALATIIAIESDWLTDCRLSDALAATLMYFADPKDLMERLGSTRKSRDDPPDTLEKSGLDIRPRDEIRKALEEAKRQISKRVNANNGIDISNVVQLVLHMGVVVKYEITEIQASESLARFRGARAHGSPTYEPTSPTDAKTLVMIMYGLFRRIAQRTAEKLSRPNSEMPI